MTLFRIEHNIQTDEVIEIPLSDKEVKEIEKKQADAAIKRQEEEAAVTQKATEKAALLAQLGITEEQSKLLFG